MKQKSYYILLAAEAAALAGLLFLQNSFPAIFSSLFAFPFEQLGAGLRILSLSGRLGNGLALALWGALSLLPAAAALRHVKEAERRYENAALVLLSAALLYVLYGMADPAAFQRLVPRLSFLGTGFVKALMGGLVWSILALWFILRLLRLFRAGDTPCLLSYMERMLWALCVLFVGGIVLSCGGELAANLKSGSAAGDRAIQILGFAVSALPYGLDIAVTVMGMELLRAMRTENRETVETAAERLSGFCCISLALSAGAATAFNVLQVLFASQLTQVSVHVTVPVMSLAFVLAVLLVSRLIVENRQLQDDNDLFI